MIDQTKTKLKQLRLPGMLRAYEAMVSSGADRHQSVDEMLSHLVDAECEERYEKKVSRYINRSRLRFMARMEEIDPEPARGLDRTAITRLREGSWIEKHRNIILTGATGTGKSFIACALGHLACTMEYRTLYFPVSKLLRALRASHADNSFGRLLKNIARHPVLVLDDFGLEPLAADARRWLLEIIEDRYDSASTIIAAQMPLEVWPKIIGDPTIADAIMDRVIHNAQKIALKKEAKSRRAK